MDIEVECCTCKKKVYRKRGEVNRNAKLDRKIYCSLQCSGAGNVGNFPEEARHGNISNLRRSKDDGYSMFRVFMHRINLRVKDRNKVCNLTLQDLKEQWEKQDGVCPYTGWKLTSPKNSKVGRARSPGMASLDRIDSNKGYVKGNVEFVSFMAQCAKNNFTKQEVFKFCFAVAGQ